jgi:hypothetical protein
VLALTLRSARFPSAVPCTAEPATLHTCDPLESAFRDLSPDGGHRIRGAPAETVPSAHANVSVMVAPPAISSADPGGWLREVILREA